MLAKKMVRRRVREDKQMGRLRVHKDHGENEDKISSLPDDLLHRILSFTDTKDAVQTSLLSTRWRYVWKSLSCFYFNGELSFSRMAKFSEFLTNYLCNRDRQADLFVFNLIDMILMKAVEQPLLCRIINYGASHNLQQLNFSFKVRQVPLSIFTIQSLKQLSLSLYFSEIINISKSSLDLPALNTLVLDKVLFRLSGNNDTVDFFSNLPNLMNLSIFDCLVADSKAFYISSSRLENLHISYLSMTSRSKFVVSAPKLSSFRYDGSNGLLISVSDLQCLDKIYLNFIGELHLHCDDEWQQRSCREVTNLFQQFCDAKFVTITSRTAGFLIRILEVLKLQSCPFRSMECLKVERYKWTSSILMHDVVTYLCSGSPNAKSLIYE